MSTKIQDENQFFQMVEDFGTFSTVSIQQAMELAEEKEKKVLEVYLSMVKCQMQTLHEEIVTLLSGEDRKGLREDANKFTVRMGGQELLAGSLSLVSAERSILGIFDGIGDFLGGTFGAIFDTVKEVIITILDCLNIPIPPFIKWVLELVCKLPGLLGGLFGGG